MLLEILPVLSCFSIFLQLALFVAKCQSGDVASFVRNEMVFIQLVTVLIHATLVVIVRRFKSMVMDRTNPSFQ